MPFLSSKRHFYVLGNPDIAVFYYISVPPPQGQRIFPISAAGLIF